MEIVRVLLERNANMNVEGSPGCFRCWYMLLTSITGGEHGPPLVAAASAKHEHIVQALVKQQPFRAAVGLTDKQGMTALHHAARHGLKEAVAVLLEYGANVGARSSTGLTPLLCAAESGEDSMAENYQDVITQLARVNGDVLDQKNDSNGWTPLIYAAHHGRQRLVQFLLQMRGFRYYDQDIEGKTALFHAT
jgi:ankyrin repeat protein